MTQHPRSHRVGGVLVFKGKEATITTIIAAKRNGKVDLAWDSQSTGGRVTASRKVFDVNGQMYVGIAGRTRYSNVLRYADVPKLHDADIETGNYDAAGYLITRVVPAWIDELKEQFGRVPDQKEEWPDGVALVVLQGRIFEISHDFTVTEAAIDFHGIGSGSDYAMGALAAGKSVEKAIEIAADLDLYTGGELHVLKGVQ